MLLLTGIGGQVGTDERPVFPFVGRFEKPLEPSSTTASLAPQTAAAPPSVIFKKSRLEY